MSEIIRELLDTPVSGRFGVLVADAERVLGAPASALSAFSVHRKAPADTGYAAGVALAS